MKTYFLKHPMMVRACLLGLLAINLRPALTAVGPLVEQIRAGTGISLTAAGLLTGLPLVILGLFGPLGHLGRRYGIERAVALALALVASGLLVRSLGSALGLLLGSLCLAAGIAIGNVLAPGLIKRDFPGHIQVATMVYVVAMGLSSALGTGLAVPLSDALGGWQASLAMWACPAFLACCAWIARSRNQGNVVPQDSGVPAPDGENLWRSGLAWQVAIFMGLQSGQFYVVVVWFPSILQASGHGLAESGWLIALYQIVALVASFLVPILLRRSSGQSWLAAAASILVAVTLLGVAAWPEWTLFWMVLMGLGGGICLVLSLVLIGVRTSNHHQAAALAVMSQLVGFLMAAAAPLALGWVYERVHDWCAPLAVYALVGGVVQAVIGYGAGRNRVLL